jgi:hypothetical protein
MTPTQRTYRHYVAMNMEACGNDIEKAILRMKRKWSVAPPELIHAHKALTPEQKNQVICELLLPF